MKFKPRHMKQNWKVNLGLLIASLVTVLSFQNCSPNIQVTDEALGPSVISNAVPVDNPDQIPEIPLLPANPFNPTTPGVVLLPIQGDWASIAFEDNIAAPNAGDRDFNDAVFNYRIAEQFNSQSQLIRIFIEVRLREKLSGSNHQLGLSLNGKASSFFENITHDSTSAIIGTATAKITINEETIQVTNAHNKLIQIFSSTSGRRGEVVKIQIDVEQPDLNPRLQTQTVDYKKYRFILRNIGSGLGIDIAEINSSDEMLSVENGYPLGFMIPADWQPPAEGQLIDNLYPKFELYREWLNGPKDYPPSNEALNWFINPT